VKVRRWLLVGLLVGLGATALLCVSFGALPISPICILRRLLGRFAETSASCADGTLIDGLLALRLPRVLLGATVGAGLGLSGAVMQGLFRNALVDPGLIGVSSGAALTASALLVFGGQRFNSPLLLTVAAFVGGLIAAASVERLSRIGGRTVAIAMILAGIAINAISGSAIGLLSYIATDAELRNLTFWNLGSLGGATWGRLLWAMPLTGLAALVLLRLARPLNVLLLGEAEALHLGIAVESVKRRALLLCILLVASSVALCGVIGFVGLVVPHLVRLIIGPDHRDLLPGSALLGAGLLLWADLLSRVIVAPAELPLGIVTAALGGPFFLALLLRERRKWSV
jgi:iron complex transport system permease protein